MPQGARRTLVFSFTEFHLYLARCYSGCCDAVIIPVNPTKYLFFLYAIWRYLVSRRDTDIVVHDHRSPVVMIFILLELVLGLDRRIYIGDDGLHSLLVDKYREKYLLHWNVGAVKRVLLKRFSRRILSLPRITFHRQLGVSYPPGTKFFDIARLSDPWKRITDGSSAIFVDQALEVEGLVSESFLSDFLLKAREKNDDLLIALHPQRKQVPDIFRGVGLFNGDLVDTLVRSRKGLTLYGYFSTALLIGATLGHRVVLPDKPGLVGDPIQMDYIEDCVSLILNASRKETRSECESVS